MQQLFLDTGYHKNPRSRYLKAINKNTLEDDYLDHGRFYLASFAFNDRYLKGLLTHMKGKTNNAIRIVSRIFENVNQRIIIESMLFYFSIEQVANVTGLTPYQVELYKNIFFDVENETYLDRLDLHQFILSEDVLSWYQKLEYLDYDALKFLIKGTQRENKIEDQLKMLAERFFNIAMVATQGIVTPETVQNGLDKKSKDLYQVGVSAAQLFTNLSRTYFQYSDVINRDADIFLKDWKFLLDNNKVGQLPEGESVPDEIKDQAKFLSMKSEELEKKLKQTED